MIEKELLDTASDAITKNEVPIAAVIVKDGQIYDKAHNLTVENQNSFSHAEFVLIKKIQEQKKSWQLNEFDIYITMEPCLMCYSLLVMSQVKNVYYFVENDKYGFTNFIKEDKIRKNIVKVDGSTKHLLNIKEFFKELRL